MKYPKSFTAMLLGLIAFGSAAFAQGAEPSRFVGPALGLTVSATQNKVDYESSLSSINGQSSQGNDSEAALIASYGFPLITDWVGTVGLSYGLKSADAGSINYTYGGTQTVTVKVKEHLSLSFAPGYRLDSNVLMYGKLAYHQMKGEYNDTASSAGTVNHSGNGFGFGFAFTPAPSIELRAEYESITYSSEKILLTTGKPKQSAVGLTLLYKF